MKPPKIVDGVHQDPIDGVSMVYTFADAAAPGRKLTQYFENNGSRAIYHDGWVAATFGPLTPWLAVSPGLATWDANKDVWELYDLKNDFSEADNLAAKEPKRLAAMRQLFLKAAEANKVFPVGAGLWTRLHPENRVKVPYTRWTFDAATTRLPEFAAPGVGRQSNLVTVDVGVDENASGVLYALGGIGGGLTLYMDKGHLVYEYNMMEIERYIGRMAEPLKPGEHQISVDTKIAKPAAPADVVIAVDGVEALRVPVKRTVAGAFSASETFGVGVDLGSPVSLNYFDRAPFPFSGKIEAVNVAPAGLVIGWVCPEEIYPHPFQLRGAIARERLDGFVVETFLVLPAKHHAKFRIAGEPPRSFPQFGDESPGIFAEDVVKKSHLPRYPRTDRLAGHGHRQRSPLPHPPRQRIGPIFRSVETAHAPVVGVEDNPGPRIDVVRRQRQHSAAGSGIAAHSGDDEMGHGIEDLEDDIVDRIDVPPGFCGRIGARLDHIEMDAVRPEIMATQQHDDPGRASTGMEERVAQTPALGRAHRPIVEIEGEIANLVLLGIDDLAECAMIGRRIDRHWRFGHASEERPQDLRRGQFDPSDRAQVRIAKFTADARQCEAAGYLLSLGLILDLQMRDPDSANTCADANRAVAPGQNLAGCTFEAILLMRSLEEATFAEQRAEDAGKAVGRAYLPQDHGRLVPRPVDSPLGLPHRRPQTSSHMG